MFKMLAFFSLIALTLGKNILLANDDGWTSTEIRAVYRDLKQAGHNVILVAPVSQQSNGGGRFQVPSSNTLQADGEFGYVKKGAPSWGHEGDDENVWYFDGPPSTCIAFAFDYLLPTKFSDVTIDLVVNGVNQGPNVSPGFYTASGTMGATYTSVYRGYPAISFSGFNLNNSFFKDSLNDDKYNSANIYASLVVDLVGELVKNDPILPPMQGLNVNFPKVGDLLSDNNECTKPEWKLTRLFGEGVFLQTVEYDSAANTMSWGIQYFTKNMPSCTIGDACDLTGEYEIYIKQNCATTVSVFSAEYGVDSSANGQLSKIFAKLN